MENLKPCPMCGDTDVDMFVDIVQCRECGLTIAKNSAEEAVSAWNNRPGEDRLRRQRDDLARVIILIVAGLDDRRETWCDLCENRRDNHAIDCAAAKAEAYLEDAK